MQENEQDGITSANPGNGDSPRRGQDRRVEQLQRRLLEAFDRLWDDFIDPEDALYDSGGARWNLLGDQLGAGGGTAVPYRTEAQLRDIRNQCRALAVGNEFAINGHDCPLC